MKTLLPITLLAIGGLWLIYQRTQISELKEETLHITRHLSAAQSTHPTTTPRSQKTSFSQKLPAWPQVAQQLQANSSQYGIYKSSLRLEEQLQNLSAQELITALKEAEESGLDKKSLLNLTEYLLWRLIKIDPSHIVLNPSTHPLTSSTWQRFKNKALGEWAKASPQDAANWFDAQDPNSFDSKTYPALHHNFISGLTLSDFSQAKNRLSNIPADQHSDFLTTFLGFRAAWTEQNFADQNITGKFAELARLLPGRRYNPITYPLIVVGEQHRSLGVRAIQENLVGWSDRKRNKTSLPMLQDYLSKIQATPAEIDLCIDAMISEGSLHLPDQSHRTPEERRAWLQSTLHAR